MKIRIPFGTTMDGYMSSEGHTFPCMGVMEIIEDE